MNNSGKKILVIEDEKPLSRALFLKLTHKGCQVDLASNGAVGLEMAEKNNYDLILCDLVMPVMDGFKVLENLTAKKIKTPVIILTNLSQSDDEKKAKTLGASEFFIKSDTPIAQIVEVALKKIGV